MIMKDLKLDPDQLDCISFEIEKIFTELYLVHHRIDSIVNRVQYVSSFLHDSNEDEDLPFK